MKLAFFDTYFFRPFLFVFSIVALCACGGDEADEGDGDTLALPNIEANQVISLIQDEQVAATRLGNIGGGELTSCLNDGMSFPKGLSLSVSADASTCEISGTPRVSQTETSYTITAINEAGEQSVDIFIVVNAVPPIQQIPNLSVDDTLSFTRDQFIPNTLITNTGGGELSTCRAQSLPVGLSVEVSANRDTCELSGTPSMEQLVTNHTVIAVNEAGSQSIVISIEIMPPALAAPNLGAPGAIRVRQDELMSPIVLSNTGGGELIECYVDGLPAGLSVSTTYDMNTCQITGTALEAQAATNYAVTAVNETGDQSVTLSMTVVATNETLITPWQTDDPLIEPYENSSSYMNYVNFFWEEGEDVQSYDIQISTRSDFSLLSDSDTIEVARYVPVDGLSSGTYYWRVRAANRAGIYSEWSNAKSFQIRDRSALPVYRITEDLKLDEAQAVFQNAIQNTPAIVSFQEGAELRYDPSETFWSANEDDYSIISYWSKDGSSAFSVNFPNERVFTVSQSISDIKPNTDYIFSASVRFGEISGSGEGARVFVRELDAAGNEIARYSSDFYKRSWGDWIDFSRTFTTSSAVNTVEVYMLVDKIIGNVVFDALELSEKETTKNLIRDGSFEHKNGRIFTVYGADNLIIEGNGASIVSESKALIFEVINSSHVIFENINFDYDPLPYSILDVVNVNESERYIDVRPKDGYLPPSDPIIASAPQSALWVFSPDVVGRGKYGTRMGIYNIQTQSLGNNLYRFSDITSSEIGNYEVNDTVIKQGRYNGIPAIRGSNNNEIAFHGVKAYAAYSGTLNLADSNKISFLRGGNDIKPGRYTSTNADSLHFYGHEIGPWVEHNTFNAQGDDAVNFKAHQQDIVQKIDNKTLRLKKNNTTKRFKQGHTIHIIEKQNDIQDIITTRITQIGELEDYIDFSFDEDVGNIYPGEGEGKSALYNSDMSTANFVIRHNTFKNNRARGISIQTKGLIANNTFEGIAMTPIYLKNHMSWGEGFLSSGTKVINNKIFESRYHPSSSYKGAIHVEMNDVNGGTADYMGQKNILIEGNLIRDWNNVAIFISNGDSIVLKDNLIDNKKYSSFLDDTNYGIRVIRSINTILENNVIADLRDISQEIYSETLND